MNLLHIIRAIEIMWWLIHFINSIFFFKHFLRYFDFPNLSTRQWLLLFSTYNAIWRRQLKSSFLIFVIFFTFFFLNDCGFLAVKLINVNKRYVFQIREMFHFLHLFTELRWLAWMLRGVLLNAYCFCLRFGILNFHVPVGVDFWPRVSHLNSLADFALKNRVCGGS